VAPTTVGALLQRQRELATLRQGFARACAGEGTLILIEGPAGVGKTELAREARAAAEYAGLVPLEARGSELEQPFAFGVVRQLLEPLIDGASGQTDLFAGAAGPAARLFERDERQGADTGFEALHGLYWLVVNLADQAPVIVLVDDCQWVDRDSLRFLTYLAQRIEGLPIAMVLAGRPPDEAESLWAQLASRPAAVALYPRPLSPSAAMALARERLGADAAEEFCRVCHAATGGNPLFLRELLGAFDAAGVVPSAAAASEVHAVGPAAVSRFVLHRLATLGPAASELARAVAVLGDDRELQLAARVSGLSEESARAAADDLVRADIFARAARLGFVHPIVRAALYEDLAPGERQARHAAAAEALGREGARGIASRAGARGDPRRARPLRSRRDAVRGSRRAPARVIDLGRRPGDPSRRGLHAGSLRDRVGRPLGRGRRRRTGIARRGASAARPRALARAGLRAVDGHARRPAPPRRPHRSPAALP
jgi:AAA ATPase domain